MEDADRVADIYIGSRRRHVAFAPLAHSEESIRGWIRQVLIPRGGVLVLEDDGCVSAMMAVSRDEQGSWIDQLYVHPDKVSRGLGSALVAEAKRILSAPIQLYTFQQNHAARRFYERRGFVAVEFTDGSRNEERCPDILFRWEGEWPNRSSVAFASRVPRPGVAGARQPESGECALPTPNAQPNLSGGGRPSPGRRIAPTHLRAPSALRGAVAPGVFALARVSRACTRSNSARWAGVVLAASPRGRERGQT